MPSKAIIRLGFVKVSKQDFARCPRVASTRSICVKIVCAKGVLGLDNNVANVTAKFDLHAP